MGEAIYRAAKKRGFTTVYRSVAQDQRLTLKARGLFLLLQSLPDDWQYTISGLSALAGTGKDQIRSGLKELLAVGYLVKEQAHHGDGKFAGNVFILQEEAPPLSENPTTVRTENAPLSDNPVSVFPTSEKPSTENPTQQNNNIHIPPIVPQKGDGVCGKKRRKAKSVPAWKPERFEGFWVFYSSHGRGEARAKAVAAWDRLQPDDALIEVMARALQRQTRTEEWQRGIGIPYASTWINGERWKDVVRPPRRADDAPAESSAYGWT